MPPFKVERRPWIDVKDDVSNDVDVILTSDASVTPSQNPGH